MARPVVLNEHRKDVPNFIPPEIPPGLRKHFDLEPMKLDPQVTITKAKTVPVKSAVSYTAQNLSLSDLTGSHRQPIPKTTSQI